MSHPVNHSSPASESTIPDTQEFLEDVLAGMAYPPYALPAKYLYDQRGSELFDQICELTVYYPTRTELSILESHASAMGKRIGPGAAVVELGSGSSNKTGTLLDSLEEPLAYLPIDIAREHLAEAANRIQAAYPQLEVLPVCADYHRELVLPHPQKEPQRHLVYFPGSTIGNLDPEDAESFLRRLNALVGEKGGLLVGVDLIKDIRVLQQAYDDPEGITAAFNRNLLIRLERELGAELEREAFAHRALFNEARGCVEMHLVSLKEQTVQIGGRSIPFREGQSIRTERSYKYTLDGFAELAARSGWIVDSVWMDEHQWFSMQYLRIQQD